MQRKSRKPAKGQITRGSDSGILGKYIGAITGNTAGKAAESDARGDGAIPSNYNSTVSAVNAGRQPLTSPGDVSAYAGKPPGFWQNFSTRGQAGYGYAQNVADLRKLQLANELSRGNIELEQGGREKLAGLEHGFKGQEIAQTGGLQKELETLRFEHEKSLEAIKNSNATDLQKSAAANELTRIKAAQEAQVLEKYGILDRPENAEKYNEVLAPYIGDLAQSSVQAGRKLGTFDVGTGQVQLTPPKMSLDISKPLTSPGEVNIGQHFGFKNVPQTMGVVNKKTGKEEQIPTGKTVREETVEPFRQEIPLGAPPNPNAGGNSYPAPLTSPVDSSFLKPTTPTAPTQFPSWLRPMDNNSPAQVQPVDNEMEKYYMEQMLKKKLQENSGVLTSPY